MSIQLDPEQNETAVFLKLSGDLAGRNVLEIGAGDGRLTWRYARRAGAVTGIEPNAVKLERARQDLPEELQEKVNFFAGDLEQYVAAMGLNRPRFDLAILSWSL